MFLKKNMPFSKTKPFKYLKNILIFLILTGCGHTCTNTETLEKVSLTKYFNDEPVKITARKIRAKDIVWTGIRAFNKESGSGNTGIEITKEVVDEEYHFEYSFEIPGRSDEIRIAIQFCTAESHLDSTISDITFAFSPDKQHFAAIFKGSVTHIFHQFEQGPPFVVPKYDLNAKSADKIKWSKAPPTADIVFELLKKEKHYLAMETSDQYRLEEAIKAIPNNTEYVLALTKKWPEHDLATLYFDDSEVRKLSSDLTWATIIKVNLREQLSKSNFNSSIGKVLFGINDIDLIEDFDEKFADQWYSENAEEYLSGRAFYNKGGFDLSDANKARIAGELVKIYASKNTINSCSESILKESIKWIKYTGQTSLYFKLAESLKIKSVFERHNETVNKFLIEDFDELPEPLQKEIALNCSIYLDNSTGYTNKGKILENCSKYLTCDEIFMLKGKYDIAHIYLRPECEKLLKPESEKEN